ncbi:MULTISPECIES: L28 family ribosomal protein [unclassified Candidatus Neoarthromitus]
MHYHCRSNKKWIPNLRKIKAIIDNSKKTVKICIECLQSNKIQRYS